MRDATPQPTAPPDSLWTILRTSHWRFAVLATLVLALAFALRQITVLDIGFHLRGGQWILQNLAFPDKDVFTYTVNDHDYVDMHWLYQVLLYLAYKATGYAGLTLLNLTLIMTALGLLYRRALATGAAVSLTTVLFFISIFSLEYRMQLRPEIITWVLLNATLLILDQRFQRRRNLLFLLPIIQVLWVNMQGLFVLGWVATVIYLLSDRIHNGKIDRKFLRWGLASFVCTLVNPWGFTGAMMPLTLATRLQGSSVFKQGILELSSPWSIGPHSHPFFPAITLYVFYFFVLVSVAGVLLTLRRRPVHEVLLLVAFLLVASQSIRNVPLFLFVSLPIICASLVDLARWRPFSRLQQLTQGPWPASIVAVVIFLVCLRVPTDAYYAARRRPESYGMGLDSWSQPLGIGHFLRQNDLRGRLLNHMNVGSWLIWKAPQPVFIDGRLEVIGEQLFQEYTRSYEAGGLRHLVQRYRPQLIVFDPRDAIQWTLQLRDMPHWRLIFWNPGVVAYAHSRYATHLAQVDLARELETKGIQQPSPVEVEATLRQPVASSLRTWLGGFYSHQAYPHRLSALGGFAFQNDDLAVAEAIYVEAIRQSGYRFWEFYLNLAILYDRHGRLDLARLCYQQVLEAEPGNETAQERLTSLPQPH